MTLPNANFTTSKTAPQERWLKLYRKIHNLYLKDEFIHKQDYLLALKQMNARVSAIEATMNAGFVAIQVATQAAIIGHVHPSPQAPAGTLVTLPGVPTAAIPAAAPSAAPIVEHLYTVMEQTDATLMATGPALAPLGDGASVEALVATRTVISEIGV